MRARKQNPLALEGRLMAPCRPPKRLLLMASLLAFPLIAGCLPMHDPRPRPAEQVPIPRVERMPNLPQPFKMKETFRLTR